MKWLFIFFLLINVIYFGWELDRQTKLDISYTASLPALSPATRRLQFLEELETPPPLRNTEIDNPLDSFADMPVTLPEPEQNTIMAGDEAGVEATGESSFESFMPDFEAEQVLDACFTFGPIADENQAIALQNWFTANAGEAHKRYTDEQGRQLFWVYLEPTSEELAAENLGRLASSGVTDYMLIRRGDLKNAISLGLFSSQDSVNRRLSELSQKGYQPVVVPHFETKDTYWLYARLAANVGADFELPQELLAQANSSAVICVEADSE